MSDPRMRPERAPEEPQVFADDPRPVAAEGGCGRAALIGCGVLVGILGLLAIVVAFNVEAVLVRLLRLQQTALERSLPEDLSAEERTRFDQAWADLYRAIEEDRVAPEEVQQLQRVLMEATPGPDRRLSHQQVRELTVALEATAAGETPPPLESEAPDRVQAPGGRDPT